MPRQKRRKVAEELDSVTCRLCGHAFRVVNWPHLVKVHGLDPEDFLAQYARLFPGTLHICRATKLRMKEGQDEWNARTGRRWTKPRILRLIREARRDLKRTPTVNDVSSGHRTAAQRHFGGWLPALRAAGLSHRYGVEGRYWTRERVRGEIRRRVASGRSIRFGVAAREGGGLTVGARREFGSWAAAVRAAGFGHLLPLPPRMWSKGELLALLRKLIREHGYVSTGLLGRARRPGYVRADWAVGRLFGSLKKAVQEGAIKPGRRSVSRSSIWKRPGWIKWSPEKVLGVLRDRMRHRLPLNGAAIQKADHSLYRAAVKRFGSWPETLRRLGLDPDKIRVHRVWTRPNVRQAIRNLGRPVGHAEIHHRDSGLLAAAKKFYGGWRRASRAAGFLLPPRGRATTKWPRERIVVEIRRRARRGIAPTSTALGKMGLKGLVFAAYRAFGGWPQAVRAAGRHLLPPKHQWPRGDLLRLLRQIQDKNGRVSYDLLQETSRPGFVRPIVSITRLFRTFSRAVMAARHLGVKPLKHPPRS